MVKMLIRLSSFPNTVHSSYSQLNRLSRAKFRICRTSFLLSQVWFELHSDFAVVKRQNYIMKYVIDIRELCIRVSWRETLSEAELVLRSVLISHETVCGRYIRSIWLRSSYDPIIICHHFPVHIWASKYSKSIYYLHFNMIFL